jgi:integrase
MERGMKEKITKRSIDALREKARTAAKSIYCFDSELTGFGAVATKTGSCSYWIEYRLGGRESPSKRVTIGKHGKVTPDEARRKAKQELGKVANGVDVAQERKKKREPQAQTLRDLIESFLAKHAKRTLYWHQKRARLLSDDLKALHGRPIGGIKRGEIRAAIDEVQARSHAAARILFSDLRPIFAWALDEEVIDANPIADMKGPRPAQARDRVLSDEEIAALWRAASQQGWPYEVVFKLLLLTGQRRNEVASMRWRELDLDAATWTFAPDPIKDDDEWRIRRTVKNGKAHTIDLHPEAVRLLDVVDVRSEDFVFSTTGRTPISGFSWAKACLDARMREILGDRFKPWRIHDLRRTAASGMAALGFQPHVIERVLNHVSGAQGGLVGVYQRHEYREERRNTILAWGDHVLNIIHS